MEKGADFINYISEVKEYIEKINVIIADISENSRFPETVEYIQHGNVSVYEHSIEVAHMSCFIANKFNFKIDYDSLIRGALLHDYFLYDWHKNTGIKLHGFTHPKKALINARKDFQLTSREENIILRHMFPLTVIPPLFLESWIVCTADKLCAIKETFRINDIQRKVVSLFSWI